MRDGPANLEKCGHERRNRKVKKKHRGDGNLVMCGGYIIRAYIIIPPLQPHIT